ncbi:MAG: haloalkane dehalogenase [Thiohalomonadales bacterium]
MLYRILKNSSLPILSVKLIKYYLGLMMLVTNSISIATAAPTIDPYSYKLPRPGISAKFPFTSKYLDVRGSKMHYVEIGRGKPIVFLHGNPTSSYLWRNILPYAKSYGRVIAIDLIGMGKSDKPDIAYTFEEHYQYIEQFINNLDLHDITLVVHDWGAAIGFNYARNHPDKVKGLVFMEGALPPVFPITDVTSLPDTMRNFINTVRDPVVGYDLIINQNFFVEELIPEFVNRSLTESEMSVYRAPYPDAESRLPIWMWPQQLPVEGVPVDVTETFYQIKKFMIKTEIPKLFLYASPGGIVTPEVFNWYVNNLKELETKYIGQGFHYVQEDQPESIGLAIADWLRRKQFN